MRAGKRNDIFPNSYTGDPLSGYRRVVRTAGWPSWNMLYMDSGPEPMGWVEPPKPEPEDEDDEADQAAENPDEGDEEVDEEAAAAQPA